jgi:hypothetical protein
MAELALTALPPRAELLRQLRPRIDELAPGLRVVAEGLLGSETRIDFVGVEASGRVVLVIVGTAEDDLALVARALAQKAWVEARLRDWRQLACWRPASGPRATPQRARRAGSRWPATAASATARDRMRWSKRSARPRRPRRRPPRPGGRRPSSEPAWSTPSWVSPPRNAANSTDFPLGARPSDDFCLPTDIF